jgi:hypothetical protein
LHSDYRIILKYLYLLSILFFFSGVYAQFSLEGKLVDSISKEPMGYAKIIATYKKDSSSYAGKLNPDGSFEFSNLQRGFYVLRVSFLGYSTYTKGIRLNKNTDLGTLLIQPNSKEVEETVISVDDVQVRIKSDTTEFSADNFKVNEDAVAQDLVKKMPSVTVENGKVQAEGEDVQKVLVNGKPFFGDDVSAALKNLPASLVDKIQILDMRSNAAMLTGIEDGVTQKAINIVTKPGFNKLTFGRVYAGSDFDKLYNAGGNINFFDTNRKVSIVFQSNNINEQNFNDEDLFGVNTTVTSGGTGGGRGRGNGPRGGGPFAQQNSSFTNDLQSGVLSPTAIGVNYSQDLKNNSNLSSSLFLNRNIKTLEQTKIQDYVAGDFRGQTYNEFQTGDITQDNVKFNLRLLQNFDSFNNLIFENKTSFNRSESLQELTGSFNFLDTVLTHNVNSQNTSNNGLNFSNTLFYVHKFKKPSQTFSLNLEQSRSTISSITEQQSLTEYLKSDSITDFNIQQENNAETRSDKFSSQIGFSVPFIKKNVLQVFVKPQIEVLDNTSEVNSFDSLNDSYSKSNEFLSGTNTTDIFTTEAGIDYQVNFSENFSTTIKLNYQYIDWSNKVESFVDTVINKEYSNFLPTIIGTYKLGKGRNLRFGTRTDSRIPNATQIFAIPDITNPIQIQLGNSALEQQIDNRTFARYQSFNYKTNIFFLWAARLSTTFNPIISSTYFLNSDSVINGTTIQEGAQIQTYTNTNRSYSLGSFMTMSKPIALIKSNGSFAIFYRYSVSPTVLNANEIITNSNIIGGRTSVTSNISPYVDFDVSYRINYNNIRSSSVEVADNSFFNHQINGRSVITFKKHYVWELIGDYQTYSGSSLDGLNYDVFLINSSIGYKFLKKNKMMAKATVFDIFNSNNAIQRSVNDFYIEDVESNVLNRYFLFQLIYNL